jgi:hypothetical protein
MLDPATLFGDELNRTIVIDDANGVVTIESDDMHNALYFARKVGEYLPGVTWSEVIVSSADRSLTFTGKIDIFQPWTMIIKGFPLCGMADTTTYDTARFLFGLFPGRLDTTLEALMMTLSMPRGGDQNNWDSTSYRITIHPPQ